MKDFFLMTVACLFLITLAVGLCKLVAWVWRKAFGPDEADWP